MTAHPCTCAFCARGKDEAELLFHGERGGSPPFICSVCVLQFAELVTAHRHSPELMVAALAAINAEVGRR